MAKTLRKEHSPYKRAKIISLLEIGVKPSVIAAKYDLSVKTIYRIRQRYRDQESARSKTRSGRPQLLSKEDEEAIFMVLEIDPFASCPDIIEKTGLEVLAKTLRRYLEKRGILHLPALRRPALTPAVAQRRLEFAQKWLEKPPE